jgi:hypothetical protein
MPKTFLKIPPVLFRVGLALMATCGLACATSSGTSRRSPPPESAADYFPLASGWKWAYQIEKGGQKILATYAVTQQIGDSVIVQNGDERNGYTVLAQGIARRDSLSPGDFILRSPIIAQASWPLAEGKATVVSVGTEVTVPAGTYPNCVVIEESRTGPDRVLRTTYAAGVGPIQLEYQVSNPETHKFEVVLSARLIGVTRPGEDPLGEAVPGRP